MKNALIIVGAIGTALVIMKVLQNRSQQMAYIQSQAGNQPPSSYFDAYWQNLKGSIGNLF